MTQNTSTGADILAAARKLQEDKLTAIQRIADTRARIATIQTQMTDAEREDANAYQLAVRAGWTEDELRKVGITPPARQAPGRPRKPKGAPGKAEVERSGAAGLAEAQLRREAEASVRMDREGDGQTHVVGDPAGVS